MKSLSPLLLLFIIQSTFGQLAVQQLKTENLQNPIGIGVKSPRFSWQLLSDKRNVKQTAYEIQVKEGNTLVWDTGKIASESSLFINYQGKPLKSNTAYTWQVRVYDNQGNQSAWSGSQFSTALLDNSEWKAQWISSGIKADTVNGIVPMLRKTFDSPKKISSAAVFITARGLYELQINGKRIGNGFLTPGWTSYNKHLQYQTYNVTEALLQGKNAIGILLGSGWYRSRLGWVNQQNIYGKETALLFQLEIRYTDGSKETIISDNSWKTAESHILSSEIYNGEIQDARKRQADWTLPIFSDKEWAGVQIKDFPKNYLNASINEPITKHQSLSPELIISPKGLNILDLGQNMVGWIKLKIKGNAGDKIKLTHIETLDKRGEPNYESKRTAKAEAIYTLSGNEDYLEPNFTFMAFGT